MKIKPYFREPQVGDRYLCDMTYINKIEIYNDCGHYWDCLVNKNHHESWTQDIKKERLLELIRSKEIILSKASRNK